MLKKIPFFSELNDDDLARIEAVAIKKTYPGNSLIFSEGEPAEGFYVVDSGRVEIFKLSLDGRMHLLHLCETSDMFAEAAVFSGNTYPASARTTIDSTLIFIPKGAILQLIKEFPELSLKMLSTLSIRLRRLTSMIEDLSLKRASARLAKYLLDLSVRMGSESFTLDIKQTALALRLGIARESLSRIFREFREKNIIDINKKQIRILDVSTLKDASAGLKI